MPVHVEARVTAGAGFRAVTKGSSETSRPVDAGLRSRDASLKVRVRGFVVLGFEGGRRRNDCTRPRSKSNSISCGSFKPSTSSLRSRVSLT